TRRVAAHFGIEDVEAIAPAVEPSATAGNRVVKQAERETPVAGEARVGAVAGLDAYKTVITLRELDGWIVRAREEGRVCVDTETTGLDPMTAGLCGSRPVVS